MKAAEADTPYSHDSAYRVISATDGQNARIGLLHGDPRLVRGTVKGIEPPDVLLSDVPLAFAWGINNSGDKGEYRGKTTSVGSFPPNAWGLYDMHGNVFEWCSDRHGENPSVSVTDPTGSASGPFRVVRGGSWLSLPSNCRSAYRLRCPPSLRFNFLGFRVVCGSGAGGLSE